MQVKDIHRDLARALALGQGSDADRLNARMSTDDRRAEFVYVTALFMETVTRYFGEDLGAEDLQKFLAEMRHAYRKADPPLKFLQVEGVIRAMYSEESLLEEMSSEDQAIAMWAVMRMIFHEERMAGELESLLLTAESTANQWISEAD